MIVSPCEKCSAKGRILKNRKIMVNVPKGVDSGSYLRVRGEGDAGIMGGPAGDLYVVISVNPHKFFTREGSDLHYELPVTFSQSALGDELEVPSFDGTVKMKIPANTQTGTYFRLKGKGVPSINSSRRGDQLVKVIVKTPEKLSKKQKELLGELSELEGIPVKQQKNSFSKFIDGIKDKIT